ncbi:MAG: hypothetical protein ACOYNY_09490 [Caldilineaceae bacterium]|jgi:hypothetical protein
MYQIMLEIPDELVGELQPHRNHLLELLQLGLAEWRRKRTADIAHAIKALFQQMADEGKLIQSQPYPANYCPPERPLVRVRGKALSEIVIEQRNRPSYE